MSDACESCKSVGISYERRDGQAVVIITHSCGHEMVISTKKIETIVGKPEDADAGRPIVSVPATMQ